MSLSTDIQISKHHTDDGTPFYIGACPSGARPTSFDGTHWHLSDGMHITLVSQLRTAFNSYLLAQTHETPQKPDEPEPEPAAEVEGYTGSIGEWPRGRAYQKKNGEIQIVLHPHDDTQDYFIGPGWRQKLAMRKTLNLYYPIPGSTGRLVPEIKEDA